MTATRVAATSTAVLAEAHPNLRVAATSTSVLAEAHPNLRTAAMSVQVLQRIAPPASAGGTSTQWWDGAAPWPVADNGWWDGATYRPLASKGWWDGAAIQPLAGGGPATYQSEVLADNPLGYWRLDDTISAPTVSVASASSTFSSEPSSQAFDGNPATDWTSNSGVATVWLRAQLASAHALTQYAVLARNDLPLRTPTAWTFEGSNDAVTWTVLDTQTGLTWAASEEKVFPFANPTAYLYYQLNATAKGVGADPYYSLSELTLGARTALDSSGNARHGAYSGTLTAGAQGLQPGAANTSVDFTNGRVTVTSEPWMDVTTQFTLEVLGKFDTVNQEMLFERDSQAGTGPRPFQFRLDSGKPSLLTAGTAALTGVTTLVAGSTYHIAVTYDGATVRLYINGVLDNSGARTGALPAAVQNLYIGCGLTAWPTDGRLAEAAFYGTALSADRIAAHIAALGYV